MAKFITLIAGNMCAGKTNKIQLIEKHKDQFEHFLQEGESLRIIPEFIDPIARKVFYRNRQENSTLFEYNCLSNRIVRHLYARGDQFEPDNNLYFFDRGIIEGAETFTRNSFEEGFMTQSQYTQFTDIIKTGMESLGKDRQHLWLEQLIVYLEVKDERILYDRYAQRSAITKEELPPLDYLKRINEKYHHFFENINTIYGKYGVNAPHVLRLDGSINGNEQKEYHNNTLIQIITKMKEINVDGKR